MDQELEMRMARYYWDHAQFCRKHGYNHEAEIYEEDSWLCLIKAVSGVSPY